jgi:hypothetical protein
MKHSVALDAYRMEKYQVLQWKIFVKSEGYLFSTRPNRMVLDAIEFVGNLKYQGLG